MLFYVLWISGLSNSNSFNGLPNLSDIGYCKWLYKRANFHPLVALKWAFFSKNYKNRKAAASIIFAPRHPYVIRKQTIAFEFQAPTLNKILLASLVIMAEE